MDLSESDSAAVSNSIKGPELGLRSAPSFPSSCHDPETSNLNHRDEADPLQDELQNKLDLKDKDVGGETEKKESERDDGKEECSKAGAGESEKEEVFDKDDWDWNNGNEDNSWMENVNDGENDKFGIDDAILGDEVEKKDEESSGRTHQYPVRPEAELGPELGLQLAPSFPSSCHDPETSNLNHRDEADALQDELRNKLDLKDKDVGGETEKKESELDDGKEECSKAGARQSEKEEVFDKDDWDWNNGNGDNSWMENVNDGENDKFGIDDAILGDEVEKKDEECSGRTHQYPVRPEAEDCAFYLKTGTCKFGFNCKFNHPIRRKNQAVKEKAREREEAAERSGQTECKYYLKSGGCKFGKACKFNHTRGKPSAVPILELNFLGLPIRLGEKECPYYMRTGSCKFGANCKFNHPDPTAVGGSDPPSGYGNGGAISLQGVSQPSVPTWSSPRTLNETAAFVPMMLPPSQGVSPQSPEWNGYQAPVFLSERSVHPPSTYVMNNPAIETNVYMHHQKQMQVEEFPERPGEPECSYFLKTGHCKFKSNCKFHHPKNRVARPPCTLSDKGLPLRPDQSVCSHYSRYGICKFGPSCKFDHPINLLPSTMAGLDKESSYTNSASMEVADMAGSGDASDAAIQQPL